VHLWLKGVEEEYYLDTHSPGATSLVLSECGQHLILGSDDGTLTEWVISFKGSLRIKSKKSFKYSNKRIIGLFLVNSKNKTLIVYFDEEKIRRKEINSESLDIDFSSPLNVQFCAASNYENCFSISNQREIRLFKEKNYKKVVPLWNGQMDSDITCISLSNSGKFLAVGSSDGKINIFSFSKEYKSSPPFILYHDEGMVKGVTFESKTSQTVDFWCDELLSFSDFSMKIWNCDVLAE
jgi:WD40 repeat protein